MSSLTHALRVFAADVASTRGIDGGMPWGVYDQFSGAGVFHTADVVAEQGPDAEFPREGWVVRIMDNWTHVESGPSASMLVEAAELVQTSVMDELGRGWPELYRDGGFVGLLTPRADDDGRLEWWLAGEHMCRAGELQALLGAG